MKITTTIMEIEADSEDLRSCRSLGDSITNAIQVVFDRFTGIDYTACKAEEPEEDSGESED